jgi:hypothetical protein
MAGGESDAAGIATVVVDGMQRCGKDGGDTEASGTECLNVVVLKELFLERRRKKEMIQQQFFNYLIEEYIMNDFDDGGSSPTINGISLNNEDERKRMNQ